MNVREPKIEILGKMDHREDAWKISRPGFNFDDLNMDDIGSMDLSLNSMAVYTLKITSSILFRDLLFSIRPIHPWARSLRSAPLNTDNLALSGEFARGTDWEIVLDVLREIEDGVPQDKARERLPMSLSTDFTVVMDYRTLAGLVKTMMAIDYQLYDIYGKLLIAAIPEMQDSNVRSYEDSVLLSNNELVHSYDTAGEMIFGSYAMKTSLTSQFLRQHHSKIKVYYWNMCQSRGYTNLSMYQDDTIQTAYYIDKSSYHKLMSIRSHWFADWSNDMWGQIVGDYIKDMSVEEFWDFLPNGNGKEDPYHRDMISRVKGEEHNLPCPIMCETPSLIKRRLQIHGKNPIISKYIELLYSGYFTDNPSNEFRQMYMDNGGEV